MKITEAQSVIIKKNWIANLLSVLGGFVFGIQLWVHAHLQYSQLDEGAYAVKGLLFATGKYIPYQDYGPWTNHMPLSFIIPGYIQVLFGPGLRTIRYFSIFLALLALVAIWITARRLGGYWWGAGAVWVYAASPAMTRFYSQSTSQVLIFFMLAWVLALSLGENLPLWRIVCGALLAGIICLTRINMTPVLIFLLGYIFWQYGWRWGLVATVASSIIVAIGLALYWPGILEYVLTRYPLRHASLITYILLFLVVGIVIFLFINRKKFIHFPILKSLLWCSVFVLLIVLYMWIADGGEEARTTTVLFTVSYHLIFLIVFILGTNLWKRIGEGKGVEIGSVENYWKYYFLIAFLESIIALVALLLLPSDPKNTWFLGYSQSRIGLIVTALIISILTLWATLRTWYKQSFAARLQNWMVTLRQDTKKRLLILVFLVGVIILSIFVTLQAIVISDMAIKAPLIRLVPFFVLTTLLGVQTLLLISRGLETHSHVNRFLFDLFAALLGLFVILHLDQNVLASVKLRSVNAAIRSHFIPVLGLLFVLFFWRGRKKWKKGSDYHIAVVISGLFITLSLVHMYATFF